MSGFINYQLHVNDLHLSYSDVSKILRIEDQSSDNPIVIAVDQAFEQLENIADIRGGYIVYDEIKIDRNRGLITIKDKILSPQKLICGYMKDIQKIALFVCTAGEGFSSFTKKYNEEDDYLKGYIIDILGSLIVENAMDWIQHRLECDCQQLSLHITNRYSPGYCNWSVKDQMQLFSLLPEKPCNIHLSNSSLMIPIKSVSGIIGIGKDAKKRAYACDICKNKACIYRKANSKVSAKQSNKYLFGFTNIENNKWN